MNKLIIKYHGILYLIAFFIYFINVFFINNIGLTILIIVVFIIVHEARIENIEKRIK